VRLKSIKKIHPIGYGHGWYPEVGRVEGSRDLQRSDIWDTLRITTEKITGFPVVLFSGYSAPLYNSEFMIKH
jgi:hypothetical protein